jgi:cytochrome c biogenesis protein CcdA
MLMLQELINSIQQSEPSMYVIATLMGIQSGFYIYQLSRVPLLAGIFGISSSSPERALPVLFVYLLGMTAMIILLGIILGINPHFNIIISLWTTRIYLILGILCGLTGILLTGILNIDDRACLPFFSRNLPVTLILVFICGALFALLETPVCPACGSNLSCMATHSIGNGKILPGLILFSLYAIGETIPLIVLWLIAHRYWNRLMKENTMSREVVLFISGIFLLVFSFLYFWTG